MFMPQRKPRMSPAMTTPRSEKHKIGGVRKGKAVAFSDDLVISPIGSLTGEVVSRAQVDDTTNMGDWRRFREVGLLNEASMEEKDIEALLEKVSTLEKELYGYQHNMGLLLMENKEWTSKHEQLNQAFQEAQEILKREQSSHLYALTTVEQREENLRKALTLEKQCVEELKKALREVQEENSKTRLTSEAKLAEADALVASVNGRSSDMENKFYSAESKLAEATRKSSELEMRLKEVETRESVLQQERVSFAKERESYEGTFHKQREYLHEWEKKLQQKEESMSEQKRSLNQREEKINEKENKLKLKEKELEESNRKLHLSMSKCKESEEDIAKRLEELTTKENEAHICKSVLVKKEKELQAFEEKLIAREGTEIQKLIDDQKEALAAKMLEFELECEERRKSLDKELQRKIEELERQKVEIDHSEEKLQNRSQAMSKKFDRVNEKEMDLKAKSKTIKEIEKIIQAEEKKLSLEKQQLLSDKDSLEDLQQETEKIRSEMMKKEEWIQEECKSLEIKKEEREEYMRLQSELKSQIEKCRIHEEFLSKEVDNLKQEKETFEKEWEILDEKQAEYSKAQLRMSEEKAKFERFQLLEGERLEKEESALRVQIMQELDDIRLQRKSFEANMEHERSALHEKAKLEQSKVIEDLEMMRRNLEIELQRRKEQDEKDLQTRLNDFEDKRMKELSDINHQKQALNREMEEMVSKRSALQKESKEIAKHKEKLKEQQLEMHNDITELSTLSINLKKRREVFAHESSRFLAFVQKLKVCGSCGQLANEFVLSDLQLPHNEEEAILPPTGVLSDLPGSSDASDSFNIKKSLDGDASGSWGSRRPNMSILQKCTSIIFSPSKRAEHGINTSKSYQRPSSSVAVNMETKVEKPLPVDLQSLPSSSSFPVEDEEYTDSRVQETSGDSQLSELQSARRGRGRTRKTKAPLNHKSSVKHARPEKSFKDELSGCVSVTSEKTTSGDGRKRQHIEDTATGGQRKRQQTVGVLPQTPGQRRYNLRRNRTVESTAAVALKKGFDMLEMEDEKYVSELTRICEAVPSESDWSYASSLSDILQYFYDATVNISGSKYVTGNTYMKEIFGVGWMIVKMNAMEDENKKAMAEKMKLKFYKYWGNFDNSNMMIYVAAVLDPRYKMRWVKWMIEGTYPFYEAKCLIAKITNAMDRLFEYYSSLQSQDPISSQSKEGSEPHSKNKDKKHRLMEEMFDDAEESEEAAVVKSEIEYYLDDIREDRKNPSFKILDWWKITGSKYKVLSLMARDLLAIPVSTVASESAFSAGGRVLDRFRSSLTPRTVEALICTQDWYRADDADLRVEEHLAELENIELEVESLSIHP